MPTRAPSVEEVGAGIHAIVGENARLFPRNPAKDAIGFRVVGIKRLRIITCRETFNSGPAFFFGMSRRAKRMDIITMIAFHLARAASRLPVLCMTGCASLVLWLKDTHGEKEPIVCSLARSDQQPGQRSLFIHGEVDGLIIYLFLYKENNNRTRVDVATLLDLRYSDS